MRRTFRLAIVPLLMSGALLAMPPPALAVASAASPAASPNAGGGGARGDDATTRTAAASSAEQQRVLRYWTQDRMVDATPIDRLVSRAGNAVPTLESNVAAGAATGAATTVLPAKPKPRADRAGDRTGQDGDSTGEPWTGEGTVTRTAGRIFFTFQGRDASCSGDAVSSGNEDVVVTAGHCVKYQGTWHTNWVFVPGYAEGGAPYGAWTARKLLTTPQWEADEDMNYDVGIGLVNTHDGRHLTEVVGGQGIAFNQPRGQRMYDFGYPAINPYDGEKLIYCSGEVYKDTLFSDDQGMKCDMNGGSSGGPWFSDFDESSGAGTQNSVNSFKYVFNPNAIYGPYFGDTVQKLYETAQDS